MPSSTLSVRNVCALKSWRNVINYFLQLYSYYEDKDLAFH